MAGAVQSGAGGGAAAALPADNWTERLASHRVPDGYRLALVGDGDADDLDLGAGGPAGGGRLEGGLPYAPGGLLDPARLWVVYAGGRGAAPEDVPFPGEE